MRLFNLHYRFRKVFNYFDNLGCWFNIQMEHDRRYKRYLRKNPRFSIDQIRENLGVTREELALQTATDPDNVAELENKGMDISVWDLYYLLDGLGCDLEIYAKRNGKKMRLRFGPGPQANCA